MLLPVDESTPAEPRCVQGLTVWFTGLSSAGKTTIANEVHRRLTLDRFRAEILDGDTVRRELWSELGYSKHDRDCNVRRLGYVADILTRNGVIVLAAAISPYLGARQEVRARIGNFVEVFVNAPIEVCEQRDVKGLYKRARAGELPHFTGLDDPYEPPSAPDLECLTHIETIAESADKVMRLIQERCFCSGEVQYRDTGLAENNESRRHNNGRGGFGKARAEREPLHGTAGRLMRNVAVSSR